MSIIQMLFAGAGIFTKTNYYTSISSKPRVTVMPQTPDVTVDGESYLFTVPATTRSISVEMWGAGGASGSARYGTSGNGGPGGYISAVIPISQIGANILRLAVGGGGGATGGGDLNSAGSNDYYARPLGQFLEFNTSTIQHVASTSTSSNPTFSTITPVTGSTVSSSNSVTYSTISPVPGPGATVSSVSSPSYSTITPLGSTSDENVTSLDVTSFGLTEGDIILVASATDTGPVNNSFGGDTSYIAMSTGEPSVGYSLHYKRVAAGETITSITGLTDSTGGGNARRVAHIAMAFRGVSSTIPFVDSTPPINTTNDEPNPPNAEADIPGCTSVIFGFVDDQGFNNGVSVAGGYGNLIFQRVNSGTDGEDATVMAAYQSNVPSGTVNPSTFTTPTNDNTVAITVILRPQQTLSTIPGSMLLSGLADGDVILVSSVSDGGTMNLPTNTGFQSLSVSGTGASPAYRVSWKKVTAAELSLGTYTITGLSLSGTISGGPANGTPAGVAHYATAFRGVDPALATPIITPVPAPSTGTGDPDPPSVSPTTANHTIVSFGFLADRSLPTVAAPTNYTLLPSGVVTVGSDATGTTQATSMVAYRSLGASLDGNPGSFTVDGSAGADYTAVTIGLIPSRTLSAIPGTMDIPAAAGLVAGDVVLVSSVSDGGTMSIPNALSGAFTGISTSTGSPSYRVSWKRLVTSPISDFNPDGSVTISGLSLSGTTGGLAAGVAHHATAFRGVDTTAATPFVFATATPGTGNPDPPAAAVSLPTSNYTAVVFGFLNNTALPTVSPPTGYNQLSTLTVSDSTPGAQATSMVAYRASLGSGTADVNPGAFSVTGVGGQNNAAVTVALRPSPVAIGGDFSTLTLPAVQPNDLIIVASVSDGGGLLTPTGYTVVPGVPSQTGSDSPSYQISYKITNGTDTQVTGLSPSGNVDGDGGGSAGVAHVASVYRGVSLTTPPAGTPANGNGNPDPPQINGVSSGDGVVVFGFLDDISITDANITAPTTPIPGYTKTVTRAVGTDNNGDNEATVMSAFKLLTTGGNENPGAFSVNGNDGRTNSAISIRLVPQVNARFSTATGACGGSGGGYSGIFLVDAIGTPLMIAGGGGGGGGSTVYPFPQAVGGNGGSGGGINGLSGSLTVFDGVNFRLLGGPGGGGGATAGGAGGLTLLGVSGTPTTGNPGEAGQIYNSPLVGGFYSGGRGANSPYTDLTSLPLQGANATGGWNRGAGGGSSRTDSFTTPVGSPTDCGGGGGAGYYGGGGGGVGDGAGGGGGGGGSNYVDPRLSVSINSAGVGLLPAVTALPPSGNYIAGVGAGGASVVGSGIADVPGNPGGNGLIVLKYFE